jgi:hypothetical protein
MSNTSKLIEKKANEFFKSEDISSCSCCNNYLEFEIDIPVIKKVCEFDVIGFFNIKKKRNTNQENQNVYYSYDYNFTIKSKKIKNTKKELHTFFWIGSKYSEIKYSNIKKFLELIKIMMSELKFNRLTGLFEPHKNFCETKNFIRGQFETITKQYESNNIFSNFSISNILGFDMFGSTYLDEGECCVCYEKTLTKTKCNHFLCLECWTRLKTNDCPCCRNKKIKLKLLN